MGLAPKQYSTETSTAHDSTTSSCVLHSRNLCLSHSRTQWLSTTGLTKCISHRHMFLQSSQMMTFIPAASNTEVIAKNRFQMRLSAMLEDLKRETLLFDNEQLDLDMR